MKKTKKFAVLFLALVMLLSLSITAFAAANGTITINSPTDGAKYDIYKMFDLESFDADTDAYLYKITEDWRAFVTTGDGKDYFSIDESDYVTMKTGVTVEDDSTEAAAIAKAALSYAKANSISPTATLPDSESYTASSLALGYYLVDSSMGALCGLTTTNPNATVNEKNSLADAEKKVEEDSNMGNFGSKDDADLGQEVNFKATIHAKKGAQNYVLHDNMSDGLTLDKTSIKVQVNGTDLNSSYYTVTTEGLTDGCDFEISFTKAYLDTITEDTDIVVTYKASLNKNAVVGLDGNSNKLKLDYGDNNHTEWKETKTYTWDLEILKYANGDESKTLAGAKFVLLNSDKSKVATFDNGKFAGWEASGITVVEGETVYPASWPQKSELTTDAQGKIKVEGIDAATYYLHETKAPDGYNLLENDKEITITGATEGEGGVLTYTTYIAKVENKSGAELPSTGGIGTTIFYVVGSVLVLAAVVLLITKKRMSSKG